jgi:hypothetical protein
MTLFSQLINLMCKCIKIQNFNIVLKKYYIKMYTAYRGIKATVVPDTHQEDRFDAVCEILIEKHMLRKLKSPFSSHIDFFYDNKHQIWEIDKTDTSIKEVVIKKPETEIYDQIREFNELPKLSIHKAVQKDILGTMSIT